MSLLSEHDLNCGAEQRGNRQGDTDGIRKTKEGREQSHFGGNEEQGECGKKETNRSNQIIKLLLIRMNEGSRACLCAQLCVRLRK